MPAQTMQFTSNRAFDALCFGRVGMDLYGMEPGKGLASVSGFRVSLGGSPGNIAVGMARLGCRVGCISRVAHDAIGDYVCDTLTQEGVDTSSVLRDQNHLTSLALAAMQEKDCEVVIYRQEAADLQLTTKDIDAVPLQQARALVMSGTALSQSPSREAALKAMSIAREHQVRVLLDLDYRPGTWASAEQARAVYQQAVSLSDLVLGNKEEWTVVEPNTKLETMVGGRQSNQPEFIIVKNAALGSRLISQEGSSDYPAYNVKARKPYGAGDAYAAALLQQLLTGADFAQAIDYGSASAALVVAADACALAMPSLQQINTFRQQSANTEPHHA